jgi:protease-4
MQQFFKFMFASCLGVFLAMIVMSFIGFSMIGSAVASFGAKESVYVKPNSVLEINFNDPIPEKTNNLVADNFELESGDIIGLSDIVEAIEYAKTDDNIKGIFLDVSNVPGGMVTRSTIRDALEDFKESNKFIVAYSKFYSQNGYYMASVADDITVHPVGGIDFRGFGAQIPFFKNGLDKLGVKMEVYYAGQFKSATEPFRLTKMSEQNRRQIREYLEPLYEQFLNDIAESRNIDAAELRRVANEWLIRESEDALTYKLADRVGYRDEVLDVLREKIGLDKGDKIPKVTLDKYALNTKPAINFKIKDKIAVIYAEGEIIMGENTPGSISDDDYTKIIRKIRQDDKVKGIVLRVNSPGGSSLTSESIWRELSLAREAGKPVVVSMGDYAASGGYYIACMADKIIAEPNTITGSIGIFAMVPNASELMNNKLGISLDTLNLTKYASSINMFHDHSPEEAAIIQKIIEGGYELFLKRVAEGRDMTRDEVHKVAQGRVWTGEKAKELGLVDEIGGLEEAIAAVKELSGVEEIRITEYPKTKDPLQQLIEKYLKIGNVKAAAKQSILKEELGELYPHYRHLKSIIDTKGPQARLPYLIDLQ